MAEKTYAIAAEGAGHFKLMGQIEAAGSMALDIPEGLVNIGGNGYGYILNEHLSWDPTASANQDGSLDALALGDDVYIYATRGADGRAGLIASQNITVPGGYTEDNSRRIGGFHYGRVRPVSEAFNAAASLAVQMVPNSVWDLGHRPTCDPTGMAEIIPGQVWADIYLSSEDGAAWPDTVPLSAYNAVPLTGTEGYCYLDYVRLARNAGKRLPGYAEFLAMAYGVPQGATGAGARVNTGIHTDYGFDCVSCLNVDQPSGNLWQACCDYFDRDNTNAWNDTLNTGKDSAHDHGQWYGGAFRQALVGGSGYTDAQAGARCVHLPTEPWNVNSTVGVRAVCDSL
jgi:hypothetical protein